MLLLINLIIRVCWRPHKSWVFLAQKSSSPPPKTEVEIFHKLRQNIRQLIDSPHTVANQYLVFPPPAWNTLRTHLPILLIGLLIFHIGILCHSMWRACVNSLRFWIDRSLDLIWRPSLSLKCSMGLRCGLSGWPWQSVNGARLQIFSNSPWRCGVVLSSINGSASNRVIIKMRHYRRFLHIFLVDLSSQSSWNGIQGQLPVIRDTLTREPSRQHQGQLSGCSAGRTCCLGTFKLEHGLEPFDTRTDFRPTNEFASMTANFILHTSYSMPATLVHMPWIEKWPSNRSAWK